MHTYTHTCPHRPGERASELAQIWSVCQSGSRWPMQPASWTATTTEVEVDVNIVPIWPDPRPLPPSLPIPSLNPYTTGQSARTPTLSTAQVRRSTTRMRPLLAVLAVVVAVVVAGMRMHGQEQEQRTVQQIIAATTAAVTAAARVTRTFLTFLSRVSWCCGDKGERRRRTEIDTEGRLRRESMDRTTAMTTTAAQLLRR